MVVVIIAAQAKDGGMTALKNNLGVSYKVERYICFATQ